MMDILREKSLTISFLIKIKLETHKGASSNVDLDERKHKNQTTVSLESIQWHQVCIHNANQ